MEKPNLAVGIIIENEDGEVLFGKRKGSHAPFWSIPGGHMDAQDSTPHDAAIREAMEELGVAIETTNLKVIGLTNNLIPHENETIHTMSVILVARIFEGEPRIMEPDKCEEIVWRDPSLELLTPHFEASRKAIEVCYLGEIFYAA